MIAIINARLETISDGILENGQLVMENGKIKAIGSELEIAEDAHIIDANGRTVTPGIIEAHCHVGIGEAGLGWEGQDNNEVTDPITPWCSAVDGINMLDDAFNSFREAGITTANVLPGSGNLIGGTSATLKCKGTIVDQALIKNPSGMKAALGENPKKVYSEKKQSPTTRMGNAALMRDALLKAQQYLDKIEKAETEDDKPDYNKTYESLIPVLKGDIPLLVHCHRADDIVTAVRIAKEFNIDYRLEHITDGFRLVDFLKENQVKSAVGPTLRYGSKVENKDRDFRTAVYLAREDIDFCLTTDHPVIAGRHLILTASLAVGWGIERGRALESITLSAAKHIGIEDRVGSLEIGKDADLVIWSGDPLEFTTFADVTIIDGEIVYEREVGKC